MASADFCFTLPDLVDPLMRDWNSFRDTTRQFGNLGLQMNASVAAWLCSRLLRPWSHGHCLTWTSVCWVFPSPVVPSLSIMVFFLTVMKHHWWLLTSQSPSSGVVWKSRWPSLIVHTVSVDVKHHVYFSTSQVLRAQELCESLGGRPYDLCGREAPCLLQYFPRAQELCESLGGRPYGLCGHKAPQAPRGWAQELSESRGGRPGLPSVLTDVRQHWTGTPKPSVPNIPYGSLSVDVKPCNPFIHSRC